MNKQLFLHVHTRRAKFALEGLRDYAETLERLLSEETARVLTHETLSDISARSFEPLLKSGEPSENLVGLRDSFPTILRGSLLPYIHASFERSARSIANLFLVETPIPKNKNTNEIVKRVNGAWPGTISEADIERLADYMHLRHACAHTAGKLGSTLYDAKRVAKAADRIRGAAFKPFAAPGTAPSDLTKDQQWSGYVEFDASFLPEANGFHAAQIERIANAVIAPSVENGNSIEEIQANIERIDSQIATLLTERSGYVEQADRLK